MTHCSAEPRSFSIHHCDTPCLWWEFLALLITFHCNVPASLIHIFSFLYPWMRALAPPELPPIAIPQLGCAQM